MICIPPKKNENFWKEWGMKLTLSWFMGCLEWWCEDLKSKLLDELRNFLGRNVVLRVLLTYYYGCNNVNLYWKLYKILDKWNNLLKTLRRTWGVNPLARSLLLLLREVLERIWEKWEKWWSLKFSYCRCLKGVIGDICAW